MTVSLKNIKYKDLMQDVRRLEEGTYEIYFEVYDVAGNKSTTNSIIARFLKCNI